MTDLSVSTYNNLARLSAPYLLISALSRRVFFYFFYFFLILFNVYIQPFGYDGPAQDYLFPALDQTCAVAPLRLLLFSGL